MSEQGSGVSRRSFLTACSAAGVGGTLLPGVLMALLPRTAYGEMEPEFAAITPAMVDDAAVIAGLVITPEQKKMLLQGVSDQRDSIKPIRALHIPNSVAPAFVFDPLPAGFVLDESKTPMRMSAASAIHGKPDLAFATVRELAELVRTRAVTSTELTKMYLARLKKFDAELHFVITLMEERALKQAAQADAEIAAGKYRGPLHGIPWGAKDLLAVKGYRTTWGAGGFEQQMLDYDATVVQRLDAAGAVLVAKLTLGALAQDDKWFGGQTRNPWKPSQGSSGSSAGPASAVSAGCVAFAIGSETLGSISSPSTVCGTTGLRPTFGFVPRTGAMALSWTMDKLGPIGRSVEDCALVMDAIYGPDDQDQAVKSAAFNWDAEFDWKTLKVGYVKVGFEVPVAKPLTRPKDATDAGWAKMQAEHELDHAKQAYDQRYLAAALEALKKMGVTPVPVELPKFPFDALVPVLTAESAAAFEELTLTGRDKLLTGQGPYDWPNTFRISRFYSAVDYIQAQRARTLGIAEAAKIFAEFDVVITASEDEQLTMTNLTGHPAVIVPNGLRGADAPGQIKLPDGSMSDDVDGPGTPVSITFLGKLYSDARLAAFARAYQDVTGFHKLHPSLE
jgi:Asp-tRNA(Asn)/Glu-tRNA(Gln) amidotransferase A subunit family amidase